MCALFGATLWAQDIDAEKLTSSERYRVQVYLQKFGHPDFEVDSGYKTYFRPKDDQPGWMLVAHCIGKQADYNAVMWVSRDWDRAKLLKFDKA